MGLTEDLREYAQSLKLTFIGFCNAASFDETTENRRPNVYLQNAKSVISIYYRLNFTPIQNLPASRSAYMLEHDYANRHLDQASHKIARFLEELGFDAVEFDAIHPLLYVILASTTAP